MTPTATRPGHTGSATTPLGYYGQYTNSDTGLIYMQARTYDPATAQLLTVDPFVALTGERYSYAEDDPINRYDPSGRCGLVCITGIGLGIVAVAAGVGAVVVGAGALATASAFAGAGAFAADSDECVTHGGISCVGAGVGFVAAGSAGAVIGGATGGFAAGATAIGIPSGVIGVLSDAAGALASSNGSASPESPVTAASSCG
jgi:RHS repeat-associated protein